MHFFAPSEPDVCLTRDAESSIEVNGGIRRSSKSVCSTETNSPNENFASKVF